MKEESERRYCENCGAFKKENNICVVDLVEKDCEEEFNNLQNEE